VGSPSNWKRHERQVAALLGKGSKRIPNSGYGQPDVSHDLFGVEVKHRKSFPSWLQEAVAQARTNCPSTKVPLTVFCVSKRGQKTQRYFVLDQVAWLDLHGGENE